MLGITTSFLKPFDFSCHGNTAGIKKSLSLLLKQNFGSWKVGNARFGLLKIQLKQSESLLFTNESILRLLETEKQRDNYHS